jgi:Tol biopolymer transport system component
MNRDLIQLRAARRVAPLALAAVALAASAGSAQAAFPGANGKIAYLNDGSRVFVANADGSGAIGPLTPAVTPASPPHWSPDGQRLVFSLMTHAAGYTVQNVYLMNADGTGVTQVTGDGPSTYDLSPSWTPDGRIVFSRLDTASSVSSGIWSVATDGTGQVHIKADGEGSHPAFSPDGTHIAYSMPDAVQTTDGIGIMNADGSGSHMIVAPTGTAAFQTPDWGFGAPASAPPPGPAPIAAVDHGTGKSATAVKSTAHLPDVLGHGVAAQVTCDRACSIKGSLLLPRTVAHRLHLARSANVTIGSGRTQLTAAGTATLRVKLKSSARRKLAHQKRLRLTLRVVTTSGSVVTTVSKQISVR